MFVKNTLAIKSKTNYKCKNIFELNHRTDQAISDVIADKIYTSAEFKKVKEIFMVRNYSIINNNNINKRQLLINKYQL